jgi:uncharacterized membrane-anchored protein YhcB (DUF1043 family)
VATEQIIPEATWAEKLGTMSVIVVAGVFIVQWLMKQLEKKDAAMRELHDDARKSLQDANAAAAKAHAEATAMIVAELRAGYEVKRAVASSLSELTAALRDQRRQ